MLTDVIMQVTPELSAMVQEIVFKNGGCWGENGTSIRHTEAKYLVILPNKRLVRQDEQDDDPLEDMEISAYAFIVTQGKHGWLPKHGEEAEFSDDNQTWEEHRFEKYNLDWEFPYRLISHCPFRYCRPIKQTKTITINGIDIGISIESLEALKEQLCEETKC